MGRKKRRSYGHKMEQMVGIHWVTMTMNALDQLCCPKESQDKRICEPDWCTPLNCRKCKEQKKKKKKSEDSVKWGCRTSRWVWFSILVITKKQRLHKCAACSVAYEGYDEFGFCDYKCVMNADVWRCINARCLMPPFFFKRSLSIHKVGTWKGLTSRMIT